MLSQEFGGALADEADAQSINHAFQRQLAAGGDLVEHVLGGLFAHALELQEVVAGEAIEVGDVLDHAAVGELVDQSVAHALDVHYSARGEVEDGFAQLGRAVGVHAAVVGLALGAHDNTAALGTLLGDWNRFFGLAVRLDINNFRNDVTAAFYSHGVTDVYSQTVNFIPVVKRGAGHSRPADADRL